MLFDLTPRSWHPVLADYEAKINHIGDELRRRADQGERVLPDRKDVFRALELSPSDVRVIIVGQDPYQIGRAHV